jgi:hypothetical protein
MQRPRLTERTALDLLAEALPIIRRAATEEARANLAPTGLPRRTQMKCLLKRCEAALCNAPD